MKNYSVGLSRLFILYYLWLKIFHLFIIIIISAGLGWFQARNDKDLTTWTF